MKQVGTFKGNICLMDKKMLQDLSNLNLGPQIRSLGFPSSIHDWNNSTLELDFLRPVKVTIVVYVLNADVYDKYDLFSENDCYLKLKIGEIEINDSKNTIQDRDNPIFNYRYEIEHEFPGASTLTITLMEQDEFFDDYIGEVKVDLEERFYNEKYRTLTDVPIETHHVINKNTDLTVGKLRFWVDIFRNTSSKNKTQNKRTNSIPHQSPSSGRGMADSLNLSYSEALTDYSEGAEYRKKRIWDISSIPPQTMELRVIVWEVSEVPNNDPEDMSDIYIQGVLRGEREDIIRRTDTHWRSSTGYGSFNWRLIFPIHIDQYSLSPDFQDKLKLELQVWDQDVITSNDFISSVEINLKPLIEEVITKQTRMFLRNGKAYSGGKKKEQTYITLPNEESGGFWNNNESELKVTIELVPQEEAKNLPAGEGRSDPNQDPFLP